MKKILLIIVLVGAGYVSWYLFSPLFIDVEVQDELSPELQARLKAQERFDQSKITVGSTTVTADIYPESEVAPTINTETSAPAPEATPAVFSEGPFPITDTPGHPATGAIELIYSPEETLVRYVNYSGTNGPDLEVYLAKDLEAKEFVSLGRAKGNKGNIIYGVPLDVDLDDYKYVMTWCEDFGVLFDYAEIN